MKRDILYILFDMCIAIAFLLISLPVWQAQAAIMANVKSITDENCLSIYTPNVNKDFAFKTPDKQVELSELIVRNHSSISRTGALVLEYSKESSLDYNYLNIILNGKEMNINDFRYVTNDTNYIFYLDDFELNSFSNLEYEILLWVNSDLGEEVVERTISYNFDTILAG